MQTSTRIKSIVFACLGTMFEWYDFTLYALLSSYLVVIFFPTYQKSTAKLLIMAIYAIAFIGRLIGGSILASFADRYGRKQVFVLSSLLMTGSTFLMAIFPVHHLHGLAGVLSLFSLRFIQGISVGSETPGALVFSYEHAKPRYKVLAIACVLIFIDLGYMLASFVCIELSNYFTHQAILSYAWRIPYIIAVIFGLILFLLRRKADETPDFKRIGISSTRQPFMEVIKRNSTLLLLAIGAYFLVACLSEYADMSIIYVTSYFHYRLHEIYLLSIPTQVFDMTIIVLIAVILIKVNFKLLLCISWVFIVAGACPSFWLLRTHSNSGYLIWYFFNGSTETIVWLCLVLYLSSVSSVAIRTSIVTLFDNLGQLIGAVFPLFATYLLNKTGDPFVIPKVAWVLSFVMIISIIGLIRYRHRDNKETNTVGISQLTG